MVCFGLVFIMVRVEGEVGNNGREKDMVGGRYGRWWDGICKGLSYYCKGGK